MAANETGEWIGANHSDDLRIPDKAEDKWSATELNNIVLNNIVRGTHGHLRTFGGIKWECELFNEDPRLDVIPSISTVIASETKIHR